MTDSTLDIPKSLQDALRNHQVIPFIGAGVSRAILETPKIVKETKKDGTPVYKPLFASWWEFLQSAADKLDEEKIDVNSEGKSKKAIAIRSLLEIEPTDYLDIAQRAHDYLGRNLWYELLKDNFDKNKNYADEESLELSKLVWELGSNLLITTNIDKVLRWTCPNKDEFEVLNTQSVEFAEKLKDLESAKPAVIYLHGYIGEKNDIVFTKKQYEDFYLNGKHQAKLFSWQALLSQKTILFIGYSLDDQNTVEQLKNIDELFKGGASSSYILLKKGSKLNADLNGIVQPIYFDDFGEPLNNLVKEMIALANGDGEKKTLVEPLSIVPFPEPDKKPSPANPPFNVPFNSKGNDFVGRVGKLEEIKQKLDNSHRASIGQALSFTGMGGLGKTQLAVEFAWNYREDYPNGVIWLTADQDIDSQLIRLSDEAVWLHPSSKSEDKIQVAKHRLKTFNDCLIIFDNLEQFSAIEEYLPEARLQVHLLATSREEFSQFSPINLPLLELGESRQLLLNTSEREPTDTQELEAVEDILAELDNLPLALELVGGYLHKRKGISFSAYAKSLKETPLETLGEKYFQDTFTNHDRNLVRTLKINDELLEATPYLREILDVLTWSGSSSMGISLLNALIVPTNEFQFQEALEMAASLNLLKKESDSERYAIHRLLAKVRQTEESIEDRKAWVVIISKRMGDWFQDRREGFEYLIEYEAEIEHLQEWQKLTDKLSLVEQIRLYWLEGYPFYHRGKFSEYLSYVKKGFDLYQNLKYSNKALLGSLLNDLGVANNYLGNPQKALEYSLSALEIFFDLFGDNHSDTAMALNNVGSNNAAIGKPQKALEYSKKALEIRTRLFGERDELTVLYLNNVGSTYGDLGDNEKSLEYHLKALEIVREAFGETLPITATTLFSVGVSYRNLGLYEKSLDYLIEAFEIHKDLFGENSPDTANSLSEIGRTYGDLDNHKKGLSFQEAALEIYKRLFGEKHPTIANSYSNIGINYWNLGDYENASIYQEKALKIQREIFGNSHPNSIIFCKNLIINYRIVGKSEQAGRLAAEFLSYVPQNHPNRKYFEEVGAMYRKASKLKKKRRK